MIQVSNVSLRYGKRVLFDEVNLKMNKVIHKRLLTEFEKPARGKLCFTI